jgi:hypothetical protein
MFGSLINPIIVLMSLSTATGILIHDTRVDKATTAAITSSVVSLDTTTKLVNPTTDLHTHVERSSLLQIVHDLKTQTPRILPRSDDKRHMLSKYVARGHHAFDNYNLPII